MVAAVKVRRKFGLASDMVEIANLRQTTQLLLTEVRLEATSRSALEVVAIEIVNEWERWPLWWATAAASVASPVDACFLPRAEKWDRHFSFFLRQGRTTLYS